MSRLCVYHEDDPSHPHTEHTRLAEISTALARVGVRFERWPPREGVVAGAAPTEVYAAYAADIAHFVRARRYAAVDVVSMAVDDPAREAARAKFAREHVHHEDEVRFFADGAGLFCLHIGAEVYALLCERADLLTVPAGTRHWFDMGSEPSFIALRFFGTPAGWVPEFTGADIAQRFPSFDQFARRMGTSVVLVDIEGTICPQSFVRQVLFSYARQRLPRFLRENARDPRVRPVLEDIGALASIDIDDEAALLRQVLVWQEADVKIGPLKQLQGLVWEEGYRDGVLVAPLYPDARDRLSTWHRAGVPLGVYSSGSSHAQSLFFRHTSTGDIRSWFAGFYDTSVGHKQEERSYRAIAQELARPASAFLFLSDSVAELDAARAAGMRTCHVVRGLADDDAGLGSAEPSLGSAEPSLGAAEPSLAVSTQCSGPHPRVNSLLDVAL